jgi:predicted nucleotidyltransferase
VPTLPDIQRYCDKIAEAFKPQRIVLFGSSAYGKPTPDSDVDVLVVMKKAWRPWTVDGGDAEDSQKGFSGFPCGRDRA